MLLLMPLAHAADAPTIGGSLRAQRSYDPVRDFDAEDFLAESNYARAWANGELPRGDRRFVDGCFQHHFWMADTKVGQVPDPEFEGWWDLGLGESGWGGRIGNGPVDLRVGALIERWGKLDLLPVADVLNARDFRAGLLAPVEFQKLPEPMAVL